MSVRARTGLRQTWRTGPCKEDARAFSRGSRVPSWPKVAACDSRLACDPKLAAYDSKLAACDSKLAACGSKLATRGFTLVEVLVALAIVAVTLAAGLRAAGALVDGSQRLADVTAAQWCAENQLAELRLTRQFPGVGDGDFPCEMLGRRYSGTLRTRPTPNPNFRRVDAIVRDEAQRPLVTVSAIVTRL